MLHSGCLRRIMTRPAWHPAMRAQTERGSQSGFAIGGAGGRDLHPLPFSRSRRPHGYPRLVRQTLTVRVKESARKKAVSLVFGDLSHGVRCGVPVCPDRRVLVLPCWERFTVDAFALAVPEVCVVGQAAPVVDKGGGLVWWFRHAGHVPGGHTSGITNVQSQSPCSQRVCRMRVP